MSAQAQREALQILGGEEPPISPEGTCSTQRKGNSLYSLLPPDICRSLDIEAGTTLVLGFHAPSNTVFVTPQSAVSGDHWAADYVFG